MGEEYDEAKMERAHQEGMKNPFEKSLDDVDDVTMFEIAIINKKNKALVTDCKVLEGEINFGRAFIVPSDANNFIKGVWLDKLCAPKDSKLYGITHAPKFNFLSEPLQNSLVEYYYSVGIRPELAICVEYLSWNKE